MDNDFNTAEAMSSVFALCDLIFLTDKDINPNDSLWTQTTGLYEDMVVSVLGLNIKSSDVPQDILDLADQMTKARQTKDYKKSDEIRGDLTVKGYLVEIAKDNSVTVRKKI